MAYNTIKRIINSKEQIETDRLLIIPYKLNEIIIDDLFEIYSSDTLEAFYMQPIKNFNIFKQKVLNDYNHMYSSYNSIRYLIILKSNMKVIGFRNFHLDFFIDHERRVCTINSGPRFITEIAIHQDYQNNGYGYEASNAIFNYLTEKNIYAIATFIHINNFISKHLITRLNFHEISMNEYLTEVNFSENSFGCSNNIQNDRIFIKFLDPLAPLINPSEHIYY